MYEEGLEDQDTRLTEQVLVADRTEAQKELENLRGKVG
jgi:hypothetical protein